jgi:hypothetical protein
MKPSIQSGRYWAYFNTPRPDGGSIPSRSGQVSGKPTVKHLGIRGLRTATALVAVAAEASSPAQYAPPNVDVLLALEPRRRVPCV